ncbi:uncharacterized protein AMSG_06275 [Thecamonas trahens ATCC 50062]|uniref:Uncharacterized protein n=1 Tax=Thecamonas trahens ATCC 50062 TaxID=461836 RepID=A0A0L0DDG7_THETB|nr:hypothetical protein AMSG_06275 [Thecamonas trahens ATCC 50062]KNC50141.1 hypothetical protein AMSG_06275 [Thecamonas trahens ATCC 50062]|eukprot:XP_013756989.1 hypothetical protein AMSG_06275 [Thecamonas trahens ATCC 50062]
MFHGTPETNNLCSGCFRAANPSGAVVAGAQKAERATQLSAWTAAVKTAMAGGSESGVRAALQSEEVAWMDDAERERRLKRLVSEAVRNGEATQLRAALEGGMPATPGLIAAVRLRSARPESIQAVFETLLELVPGAGEALSMDDAIEVLYRGGDVFAEELILSMVTDERLVHVKLTDKFIKAARYANSRTNGGPFASMTAFIKKLEEMRRVQRREKAAAAKRAREAATADDAELSRATKRARHLGTKAGDDEAGASTSGSTCTEVATVPGMGSAMPLTNTGRFASRIYSCGLVLDPATASHEGHGDCSTDPNLELATKVTKQLQSWMFRAEGARAFIVRPETLAEAGADLGADDLGLSALLGADLDMCQLHTLKLKDSRKTFFHKRHYFDYRIDSKRLAKTKAATNLIKRLCVKNSCVFVQYGHEATATFDPVVWIVGVVKDRQGSEVNGGLACVAWDDEHQDHYHHGSM